MLEWSVTGMVYADSPVNQSLVVLIAQHLDLVEPNGET